MNWLSFSESFVGLVWGDHLVYLLLGSGLFFTIYFGFPQIRFFKHAIDIVRGKFDRPEDKGEISHFQALCTALSATIGLGNIAGVAIAVSKGGPGAVFWMWVAGFIGMTTKFTEVTLSLNHRDIVNGKVFGGPMIVIKKALPKLAPLATFYAICTIFSSFGAGNMFQSNQMAATLHSSFDIPTWFSGLAFSALAFAVLIGGIKRIAKVTDKLVPGMVLLYFAMAIGIVVVNFEALPGVLNQIFSDAFTGTAAVGGFLGVSVKEVISFGIRRAVFSNEAGMGSAAIAHSAAKTAPLQEGFVALLEPFIDTIVVCSITAFAVLMTGAWLNTGGAEGVKVTEIAFSSIYGQWGQLLVTATVVLFAFSTIISWSYYGEQATHFLVGHNDKLITLYRWLFVGFVYLGAVTELKVVLNMSDALFGLMAFPNLLACWMLSGQVKKQITAYKY